MKSRMRAVGILLALTFFAALSLNLNAQAVQGASGARASGPVTTGKVYNFEKIADGVYYATSSSAMATGGNHPIFVGDRDVFLVDAGTTPAAARALLEDLKLITDKPVRWVVNTHFHFDHTNGNSVLGPMCRSSATNTSATPSPIWTCCIASRSRPRSRTCRFKSTR